MSLTNRIGLLMQMIARLIKRLVVQQNSMTAHEKITPNQALEWCQNFLGGAWSTITVDQLQMDRVPGGLSNYLYCCSLPAHVEVQNNEPRKVLLRIYGEAHRQHRSTLLNDSVVCTLLSERKLGPHVYGIFPDGRLEELVDAESLLSSEIRDGNISRKIAGLLAELHQINMPLIKEPIWLFHTIERFLSDMTNVSSKFKNEDDRLIFQQLSSVCNFPEEFQQLKNLLSTVDSPVCFTHNDFQPGNILRLKSHMDSFTVIDFEYCSYNYRGFDIGNHFCEFMFDYKSANEWPFFKVDFHRYPDENQQMNFLTSYTDTLMTSQDKLLLCKNDAMNNSDGHEMKFDRNELAQQIMKEANYFALAAHFFWTLWSINMAASTTIQFGYLEYARARLTAYYLQRDILTGVIDDQMLQMPPKFTDELLRSPKNRFYKSYIEAMQKCV